ncbi:MAG TPA: DUF362 domain-containing protein [Bryobacteraceae bacterium]|nr:DUF362 domain-containing protein [Bryobacteraceae bacterium]
MHRRTFLQLAAATPLLGNTSAPQRPVPNYKIVVRDSLGKTPSRTPKFPGAAVRVQAAKAVDAASNTVDAPTVRAMLGRGICELTGSRREQDAWGEFVSPQDIVGIKVNCSGAPDINTNPELVSAIMDGLFSAGVKPENVYIYDRFANQLAIVKYQACVTRGATIAAAEEERASILRYDPFTYVEVDFFGEDDTRSNLFRMIPEKFTKIVNVPTMKEHRAAGVTGCLKNMAYGSFSNVARSHRREVSNTYSFIGTLASVEPLHSKVVLNVMDGLRSLWHGGPFLQSPQFLFFPKRIVLGTDPVAMDHLLIEMIEEKRKQEGAPSIFDRSESHIRRGPELDPQFNSFIREPGHVEYAGHLELGVFERGRIKEKIIQL